MGRVMGRQATMGGRKMVRFLCFSRIYDYEGGPNWGAGEVGGTGRMI